MNPLKELKNIMGVGVSKKYMAVVESIIGNKVRVKTGGSTSVIWGIAKVGDTVMVSNSQIIAIVNPESIQTVYIP